jgi:DNA-directed RNA polymerase II subunit RPB2
MEIDNTTQWNIIQSYFRDNPQSLVRHHIESYNDFFKHGIFRIFKEKNPIELNTRFDKNLNEFRSQCKMYFGGKDGTKIYFGKPVIYDDTHSHYMFPNEARLRNMTYGMAIHYDIEVEFIDLLEEGEQPTLIGADQLDSESDEEAEKQKIQAEEAKPAKKIQRAKKGSRTLKDVSPNDIAVIREATEKTMIEPLKQKQTIVLEKILLGKFPIMLQSDYCILNTIPREMRHSMGECLNDVGGYFIIDGKEKTVIAQEKFADNMLYVHMVNSDDYLCSAEIRSVSENVSKPIRTLSVKLVAPSPSYTFKNIVVHIPNVRKPVPLFIVFRALGIYSDKQIITMCLLDLEKYDSMVDLFIPSVHDSGGIMTQRNALNYIAILTKGKTVAHALEILSDYFLPHVGEVNFTQKAYYLGYMAFRLLSVYTGMEQETDRDNFKFKRIELVGSLMYDLFREYYNIQQRQIHLAFEEKINYNESLYANNLYGLITQYYKDVFRERAVEIGFKKGFKGNWGSQTHTKRVGVVQDLNRLSFNSALSHLRKTNLPLDAGVKLVGPRVLHSSQWGFLDPIDTPDGGNIGLHKHLSISTYITRGVSREPMMKWLREKIGMQLLEDCSPAVLASMTKVIVNGLWCGAITDPLPAVAKIKLFRRNALLPIYTSVTFNTKEKVIFIYTDAGRMCRPIFYRDIVTEEMSMENENLQKPEACGQLTWSDIIQEKVKDCDFVWNDLITGFHPKKIENFDPNQYGMYELYELYDEVGEEKNPAKFKHFLEKKAVIDYIDCSESEDALIAMNQEELKKETNKRYTHLEIHESLILGVMCNMIIFPENNPATRNSFSCGQSKQACSMYHTNHQVRMDKTATVLVSGQTPLLKSRYLEHINHEGNPYGENAIVAIMCYTGYNVEDAMLLNEGSLQRGLFRTTYYSTYESHEEKTKTADATTENIFTNIENEAGVVGTKPGYDYSQLDKYGIIREGTVVDEKTVLIGVTSSSSGQKGVKMDMSKTPKKGQIGVVDKTFITDSEEGQRIAKVRVREVRIPNIGDKMASRAGQKGTIGLVVPEQDMPFTKEGIRPDIIINPHAIPSRMTIGQLVESITGKACAQFGGFGDCTAFNNKGSKIRVFGELLTKAGYHSSGNEILYNGMTGEQISTEIFIGPNYYMRLKHMVKDKINYRALGPRTALTRQPVSGRAKGGGLRIGEMERDVLISHGATNFLTESMMERGDKYYVAICNTTGMLAVYNPIKNLFLSPMADGPLKYVGSLDGKEMHIENVTKFGRNFSVVKIPYSLKLLIQELQTMNIQMRIITEDTIQQLENMTFSKNIHTLLFEKQIDPKQIVEKIKNKLSGNVEKEREQNQKKALYAAPATPEMSPQFEETSPAYVPTEEELGEYSDTSSPKYIPAKDEFEPSTPEGTPPPRFAPTSPEGPPPFEPTTPEGTPPPDLVFNDREQDQEKVFMKEEEVHLRGDLLPERLWTIRNIGDQFITIETKNTQGLAPNDDVKIVESTDLYRPSDFAMEQQQALGNSSNAMMGGSLKIPANVMTPGINFAPVIRINNGGYEYSNDAMAGPSSEATAPLQTIPPFSGKGGIQINKATNDPETKQDGGSEKQDDGFSLGGIMKSASDFVIKKLGT